MKRLAIISVLLFGLSCGVFLPAADFNGDGTGDIAIFRASSGLWSVRGITRSYFGGAGDRPVPGDYDGSGTDSMAVFRSASGLWALRGISRAYFGGAGDEAKPGDYNGDGVCDIGIFRSGLGLWAARGITRVYYGASGDEAIPPVVTGGKRPSGLPKTGQFDVDIVFEDAYYANPAGPDIGNPRGLGTWSAYTADGGRFTLQSEGGETVVVDNATGLMWEQKTDDGGLHDKDEIRTWATALTWVVLVKLENFAGHNDWRLPNRLELESILDFSKVYPTVDVNFFPNTWTAYYWSSTTFANDTGYAWIVDFEEGHVDYGPKFTAYYVRAVRGGE